LAPYCKTYPLNSIQRKEIRKKMKGREERKNRRGRTKKEEVKLPIFACYMIV
jgi:hypothetical protein